MIENITIYKCDLCKKVVENNSHLNQTNKFPVITNCEWEGGKQVKPHIVFISVDICNECLLKATNLLCDYRGENIRFIEN